MTKFDKFISMIIIGVLAPTILLVLFWWGSIPFVEDDSLIMCFAYVGLVTGIVLDFTLFKKHLSRLFQLPLFLLIGIALYYSLMVYGFFMGFPLFNVLVGIASVYIMAKRAVFTRQSQSERSKSIRHTFIFSAGLLFFFCVCTALLALGEPTITDEVQGMLGLPFSVTTGMIWTLILAGGAFLLLLQYLISRSIVRKIIKIN